MPMRVTPADIEAIEEPIRAAHQRDFEYAGELVSRWGFAWPELVDEIARLQVAAPSWALGAGGTRFASFPIAGEPRTTEEKIDDIAVLHALTGANGSVSLHVPWDDPPDPSALARYAAELGLRFDAMNSNTFQDNPSTTRDGEISYKFGSMCHTDPRVRQIAVEHNKAVVEMGIALGSTAITVWLADGTNHPGQASLRGQFERVAECLKELHDFLPTDWAVSHRAQALRAGLLLDGQRGLGLVAAARPGGGSAGEVPGRPGTPPAGLQHRAGGEPSGHGRAPRWLPLQRLQVRR